jgi:transcription elongation factor Elf1
MNKIIGDAIEVLNDFFGEDEKEQSMSPADAWRVIREALKEQKSVKPEWHRGAAFCGNCGKRLEKKNKGSIMNCPECGRKVDWE